MANFTLTFILLQCILLVCCHSKQPMQCNVIANENIGGCKYIHPVIDHDKDIIHDNVSVRKPNSNEVCKNPVICRRLVNITCINRGIHQRGLSEGVPIANMLHQCCGGCTSYRIKHISIDLSKLDSSVFEQSDIIYPVIARSVAVNQLYGFYYIPVFNVPSAYYFTLRKSKREMASNVISACLHMWPLLMICLLMAMISGCVVWVLETGRNSEEFDRRFHIGFINGFWWSFISMTTVGYGDKAPKSCLGRMFAVVWILIGITICSIFTASLTTEILEAHSPANTQLTGKIVGGLNHHLPDVTMIAQHEGILRNIQFNDTIIGIAKLIEMLKRGHVNGFLVSRPTYYEFTRLFKLAKYKDYQSALAVDMVQTEKFFRGEKLVSGMIMKDFKHYEYFMRYFENNWLQVQNCFEFHLNSKDKSSFSSPGGKFYSPVEGLFVTFLTWCLGVLVMLVFCGILYEIRRQSGPNKSHKTVVAKDTSITRVV